MVRTLRQRSIREWVLFGLLCVMGLPASVRSDDAPPRKYAFLVGINKYQKRGFKDLDYAERDVTELEKVLKTLGFKTVLLTGSGSGSLKATRTNIEAQLKALLNGAGKEDIVLVALSGHGQQLTVVKEGTEKDDGFYCPYEAEIGNAETQFSLTYLTDEILAKKGGRNLVLIDACRDVPKDPGKGGKGVQGKVVSLPEDTALLFSCRAGQQSWENDELKHGVFTYCVLEGLRGEAAKGSDITWISLVGHVEERMSSPEMKKYLPKPQEPVPAGGGGRTVLGTLARTAASTTKPIERPPITNPKEPTKNEPRSSQEFVSKSTGMKLVLIPAGTFVMGSPSGEAERIESEGPQHNVKISRPFYMGVYEVTQGEYEKVMGTNPSYFSKGGSGSGKVSGMETGKFPVEQVSWFDAVDFCNKLSDQDGLTAYYSLTNVTRESGSIKSATVATTGGNGYRLPTEAEWEYACRGHTTTPFHFGSVLNGDKANIDGNYPFGTTTKGKYLERPTTVGSYVKNEFGLYDMHGNVHEWCFDVYDASDYGKRGSGATLDPLVTSGSEYRVLRGGSWFGSAGGSRTADRNWFSPDDRDDFIGFRVVR